MNTTPAPHDSPPSQALDPINRITEILFGLIMVLTFTCTLSVSDAGKSDVREMLLGALGCNLAWGIIDAFFYILSTSAQRGRERILVESLRTTTDQSAARALFASVVPQSIIGSLTPESFRELREHLLRTQIPGKRESLVTLDDVRASLIIFALVFLSTFPVSVPFMVWSEPAVALRWSNAIALLLLFSLGFSLGRYAGRQPFIWGLAMTIIGASLVSMTIALGG